MSSPHRWPRQMASSNGLCRYGARVDCCWGWTRRSWGHCQPLCQPGCKHGDCVGPNKCKCHPGFTGKTCNQDLNECGLKPRPCKHRCMNTYGSYKCYCLNGYMLMPDGTCGNARSCAMANCQYGCEVLKGDVRCQCPSPGLRLASDGRTCVGMSEFRKCINTFGSYICKCHEGFDLQYFNGKYQCIDVDECSLGQSHCSSFATCFNTPGSYKCKCKDGYRGMGHDCKSIPKVVIDPPGVDELPPNNHNRIPNMDGKRTTTTVRAPVTQKRIFPVIPKSTTAKVTTTPTPTTKAPMPPRMVTPSPRKPAAPTRKPYIPPPPPPPVTPVDNTIQKEVTKQRGDVHKSGYLSCSFDDGLCGWIRDKDGDLHWETTPDPSGGQFLTIPEVGNKRTGRGARLVLPLTPPWNDGNLCLSFRHKLAGHHVGMLQVFVKKGKQYSPAVWGRTGGNGWRHTQITLWGTGLESVILKGERGRGRSGEMAVDDIALRKGSCAEEHNLRRL
uniref:Uncharacterized protein n=1 Tax=Mola mola TaxID=94237 RepID=A0A3Q4AU46_MOLML